MTLDNLLEQLDCIARYQPVFPGDFLAHHYEKALRLAGLVKRDDKGYSILTGEGERFWKTWQHLEAVAKTVY
jgi:hypothetical protein